MFLGKFSFLSLIWLGILTGCDSRIEVETQPMANPCEEFPNSQSCREYQACVSDITSDSCLQAQSIDSDVVFVPPSSEIIEDTRLIKNTKTLTLVTRSKSPSFNWTMGKDAAKYVLVVSGDPSCLTEVHRFEAETPPIDLSGMLDGNYYLCLYKVDQKEAITETGSGAIRMIVDRTAPELRKIKPFYFNSSGTIELEVNESTPLSGTWSIVEGPGEISFESVGDFDQNSADGKKALSLSSFALNADNSNGETPTSDALQDDIIYHTDPVPLSTKIAMTEPGRYLIQLELEDFAYNAHSEIIEVYYDITPPKVDLGDDPAPTAGPVTISGGIDDSAVSFSWTVISKPETGDVIFSHPEDLTTEITATTNGHYLIELKAVDAAGNEGSDTLTLTWFAAPPLEISVGNDIATHQEVFINATTVSATAFQWEQVSGPGKITFGSPDAEDTSVLASEEGLYELRLTASNPLKSVSESLFLIWDTTPPTVSLGNSLKTHKAALQSGTVLGEFASLSWSQIDGPGTVTFTKPHAQSTEVLANKDGKYFIRLTAIDQAGNVAYDTSEFFWDTTPPSVNAGDDIISSLPIDHRATTTDAVAFSWTQKSGDGQVSFSDPHSEKTQLSADSEGSYTIRLTVEDEAGNTAYDEIHFTWDTTPPSISIDEQFHTNKEFSIEATVTDGFIYQWAQMSGPGTVTFSSPTNEDTTLTADADGEYIIRLTVSDAAGNSAFAETLLIWDTVPPLVDVGAPLSSHTQVNVDATTSGADFFSWIQQSGPGTLAFSTATKEDTLIAASQDGTYLVRLEATDLAGNSAYDDLEFTLDVTPPAVDAGENAFTNSIYVTSSTVSDDGTSFLWTQQSGPGTLTFGSPTEKNTSMTADTSGTYTVRLTATDDAGNSAFDDMAFIWDTTPPTINAGADLSGNSETMIDATTADVESFQWSQQSGPGTITFGSPNEEDSTVTANQDGIYTLRLTGIDAAGNISYDELIFTWDGTPPTVSVGTDITSNGVISVDATTTGATSFLWSQESGPGQTAFGSANSEDTTIIATVEGTYTIRLTTFDDSGNSAFDEMNYILDTTPPTVDVGPDITTSVPTLVDATSSQSASYQWSQTSGPGNITFSAPQAQDTNVSADTGGAYTVRLTVTDINGNAAYDELIVTWDTTPPSVNAGTDQETNTQIIQDASVTGGDSYQWAAIAGPGTITFGSPTSEDTTISADTDGVYTIRLTATNTAGNSASDDMTFIWDTTPPTVDVGDNLTAGSQISVNATTTGGSAYTWSDLGATGKITFGNASAEDTTINSSADGTYTIQLNVTDNVGNTASDSLTLIWDTTGPTVFVGSDVTAKAQTTLDAATSGAVNFSWSQESGPGSITFGTANAEDTTISADTDGTYLIKLTADDGGGNSNNDSLIFIWDTVPPTVTVGGDITTNGPVDIDAFTGGASIFSTGSQEDSNITVDTDGTYTIRLTVADQAGNTASDELTLIKDSARPSVVISSTESSPTNATVIPITVTFSEPVSSFVADDIIVTNGTKENFGGTGTTYSFDVTSPSGIVTVDIAADVAIDSAGNGNDVAAQFAISYDTINPSVTLASSITGPTNQTTIPMTVTFSEDVTGFALEDIVINGGTGNNFVATSATHYTFAIHSPVAGTITVDIPANKAQDNSSNGNDAATQFSIIYDGTPPAFTHLIGINDAADGYINETEKESSSPMLGLNASGFASKAYSQPLDETPTPNICDSNQNYPNSNEPLISSLPSADDSYAVCVKLIDSAGNITYGKSQIIVRDTTPPEFTSILGTNEASDGIINPSEASSNKEIGSLSATGYNSDSYTGILEDTPPQICDSNQSYTNNSMPIINTIPTKDDTYVICTSLTDLAGNITYGRSQNFSRTNIVLETISDRTFSTIPLEIDETLNINASNISPDSPSDAGVLYSCSFDRVLDGFVSSGLPCDGNLIGFFPDQNFSTNGQFAWTIDPSDSGAYELKMVGAITGGSDEEIFQVHINVPHIDTSMIVNLDANFANLYGTGTSETKWEDFNNQGSDDYDGMMKDTSHEATKDWQGTFGNTDRPRAEFGPNLNYMNIGSQINSDLTAAGLAMISAWIRPADVTSSGAIIFGNGGGIGSGIALKLHQDGSGKLQLDTGVSYVGTILADNPLLYWRLNESSGTSVDNLGSVGDILDGTYVNAPTLSQPGAIGDGDKSVNFDGNSDYAMINSGNSSLETFPNGLTIEAWVKSDGLFYNSNHSIVYKDNMFRLSPKAGQKKMTFSIFDGSWKTVTSNLGNTVSQWHHFVGTYDPHSGQVCIYLDGVAGSCTASGTINTNTQALYIGKDNSTNYFDGNIDEVAIYDRLLTAAEILEHYQSGESTYCESQDSLVDNQWVNVATTLDGTSSKIYIDGILQCTATYQTSSFSGSTDFVIGSRADGSNSFDGGLAKFKIYDAASESTIQYNYNNSYQGFSGTTGPVP